MSIKQETLRETGLSVDLVEVQYFEILFFQIWSSSAFESYTKNFKQRGQTQIQPY